MYLKKHDFKGHFAWFWTLSRIFEDIKGGFKNKELYGDLKQARLSYKSQFWEKYTELFNQVFDQVGISLSNTKVTTQWTQDVNWTYIRRSEDLHDVSWKSYAHSIYTLYPGSHDLKTWFLFPLLQNTSAFAT